MYASPRAQVLHLNLTPRKNQATRATIRRVWTFKLAPESEKREETIHLVFEHLTESFERQVVDSKPKRLLQIVSATARKTRKWSDEVWLVTKYMRLAGCWLWQR
jgi:hypothetical protein